MTETKHLLFLAWSATKKLQLQTKLNENRSNGYFGSSFTYYEHYFWSKTTKKNQWAASQWILLKVSTTSHKLVRADMTACAPILLKQGWQLPNGSQLNQQEETACCHNWSHRDHVDSHFKSAHQGNGQAWQETPLWWSEGEEPYQIFFLKTQAM